MRPKVAKLEDLLGRVGLRPGDLMHQLGTKKKFLRELTDAELDREIADCERVLGRRKD